MFMKSEECITHDNFVDVRRELSDIYRLKRKVHVLYMELLTNQTKIPMMQDHLIKSVLRYLAFFLLGEFGKS